MSDFVQPIIGIVWGITKQIVTDVIGEYLIFFPLSWEYSGNIPMQLRGNNFKYSPHHQ